MENEKILLSFKKVTSKNNGKTYSIVTLAMPMKPEYGTGYFTKDYFVTSVEHLKAEDILHNVKFSYDTNTGVRTVSVIK